jgi:hypothetical protein
LLWILRALLDPSAFFIAFVLAVLNSSAANGSPTSSAQPWKNAANRFSQVRVLIPASKDFFILLGRPFEDKIAAIAKCG